MSWIIGILVTALAFFVGAKLLPGVQIKNFMAAIVVALVVALLDFTLGSLLKIATLGLLTLGIFTFLLNAILIYVADFFISDFKVRNFWWALGLALFVAVVKYLFGYVT